jgi:hypothetical protein
VVGSQVRNQGLPPCAGKLVGQRRPSIVPRETFGRRRRGVCSAGKLLRAQKTRYQKGFGFQMIRSTETSRDLVASINFGANLRRRAPTSCQGEALACNTGDLTGSLAVGSEESQPQDGELAIMTLLIWILIRKFLRFGWHWRCTWVCHLCFSLIDGLG